jgi:hypothetical protein
MKNKSPFEDTPIIVIIMGLILVVEMLKVLF